MIKTQPSRRDFFIVANSIFEWKLKPRDFAVYCCLLRHADIVNHTCFPSRRTISKECQIDKKTVDVALNSLVDVGLIRKITRTRFDGMLGKLYIFGKDIEKDYDKGVEYLKSSADMGNRYAEQMIHSIEHNRNINASIGIINLLYHLSRTINDKTNYKNGNHDGIDRKLKRKIDEKKQAQGLKI